MATGWQALGQKMREQQAPAKPAPKKPTGMFGQLGQKLKEATAPPPDPKPRGFAALADWIRGDRGDAGAKAPPKPKAPPRKAARMSHRGFVGGADRLNRDLKDL